jgi:hypothetical protein
MNCVSRKRPCSYAPVEVPVRERKSLENFLPGEQAPWAIGDGLNQLSLFSPNKDGVGTVVEASQEPLMNVDVFLSPLPGHPLDPFDSLPIKLSFKSKELLHYCRL